MRAIRTVLDPSIRSALQPAAPTSPVYCDACDPDYEGQGDRHAPEACPARPRPSRIHVALDLLRAKSPEMATMEELAAACGIDPTAPYSNTEIRELRAALRVCAFVSIDPGNGTREDRYSLRSVGPTVRRSDPTASAIRAMLLECATEQADALADYWIAARSSGDETAAQARSSRAFCNGNVLRAAFACYVSSGGSPAKYLRNYPTDDDEDKAANEALAEKLEARLNPPPPGCAVDERKSNNNPRITDQIRGYRLPHDGEIGWGPGGLVDAREGDTGVVYFAYSVVMLGDRTETHHYELDPAPGYALHTAGFIGRLVDADDMVSSARAAIQRGVAEELRKRFFDGQPKAEAWTEPSDEQD